MRGPYHDPTSWMDGGNPGIYIYILYTIVSLFGRF